MSSSNIEPFSVTQRLAVEKHTISTVIINYFFNFLFNNVIDIIT